MLRSKLWMGQNLKPLGDKTESYVTGVDVNALNREVDLSNKSVIR